MKRTTLKQELLAEFLGTFVLVGFGVAVVAQVILSEGRNGSYLSINLGWGLAVVMGVYVAGGVTGAHLNPAVTGFGRATWLRLAETVSVLIAQVAGGS
jgi:glycerol uptake facilitator-like aquaporin